MRINKFVAKALGVSRRRADELIDGGLIMVNGQPAVLGRALVETDELTYNEQPLILADNQYLLFHKPVGYLSSRRSQGEVPTLYELLPEKYHSLKPVGRLDKDSSGLMLLTNDGDYAHQLTHPSFHKQKVYEVELDQPLPAADADKIRAGVDLKDGPSSLQLTGEGSQWTVEMFEGRNRQIRRTFEAAGYSVIKLHRTAFGPYLIDQLKPGENKLIATPESD